MHDQWPTSVFLGYCGQTTVESPVCCCALLLLVNFALDVSQAIPSTSRQLSSNLVRNRITPPGGRQQRRLVVYTQNSSGIKCTPLSGRFGQIGYHYRSSRTAQKMCAPVLKWHQLQGGGLHPPDTQPGALPPGSPLGLCPQTPVIGSCSAFSIAAHPSAPPTSNYFRRPCLQ